METSGIPVKAGAAAKAQGPRIPGASGPGTRRATLLLAARLIAFVAAVAIVVVIGVRAAGEVRADRLTWWPLPVALAATVGWWLLLARGWGILVTGRATAKDVSAWCRTQTLRYLPGGIWAPASRAAIVHGGLVQRLSTVAAENVLALCAALTVGGVALAASGAPLWLALILTIAVPVVAPRLAHRTGLASDRTRLATLNYLLAFLGYALAAVLVQAAVSGFHDPLAVAGSAALAWAAGLVVVFAPSGVGVRELTYIALLSHALPPGQLAAGAVTFRLVTIAAELGVLLVAGPPRLDATVLRAALAPAALFLRRHALFLGVLATGVGLRILTTVAYRPALLSYDSQGFLQNAAHLRPNPVRPIGYPLLLRILDVAHGLAMVPAVQHLLGLGMAVLIYSLLLRLGVRRWAAVLAAAPVLLDAYQLNIEHYVLSETLFMVLVLAACAVLLWRRRPGVVAAGIAGLLLAGAALTRANGIVVLLPALVTVLGLWWSAARPSSGRTGFGAGLRQAGRSGVRGLRSGLPVAAVLLAAFGLPVAGYGLWFHRLHGSFAITSYGKRFLYARVSPFVDCSEFTVPRNERALCPVAAVGKRPTIAGSTVEFYRWHPVSPVWRVHVRLAGDFARRAILAQPGAYLRTVTHDFLRGFAPIRTAQHGDLPISRWQFPSSYPIYLPNTAEIIRAHGGGGPAVDKGLAHLLRGYQRFGFAPGPVLILGLLGGLLAALGLCRARRSGLRSASFLFVSTGLVTFGSTVVANQFSWRYMLPLVVLLPPAAALGLTALLRQREAHSVRVPSGIEPHAHAASSRQDAEGPAPSGPLSIP